MHSCANAQHTHTVSQAQRYTDLKSSLGTDHTIQRDIKTEQGLGSFQRVTSTLKCMIPFWQSLFYATLKTTYDKTYCHCKVTLYQTLPWWIQTNEKLKKSRGNSLSEDNKQGIQEIKRFSCALAVLKMEGSCASRNVETRGDPNGCPQKDEALRATIAKDSFLLSVRMSLEENLPQQQIGMNLTQVI